MTQDLEELITRFLTRIFGGPIQALSLERLTGGASQETYRLEANLGNGVAQVFALRRATGGLTPDPTHASPGLTVEARLFGAAKDAGIPEPEVLAIFEPSDGLGPGFLLEWLSGETLGPRIVRSEKLSAIRPKLARQCGEMLGRLHRIDVEAAGLKESLREVSTEQYVRDTWHNYRRLPTVQPMIDYTALWLLDNLPEPCTPQLVHNDFRNGNLMVDPELGVIAVLDWELAHLGDPMRDLGWLCCNSWRFGGALPVGGFGRREDLFAGYQSVTGIAVDANRLRFWEVFGSFWWAVGTLLMAQQYRDDPTCGIERIAIGRRTSECQMDCVNLLFPGPFEVVECRGDRGSDRSEDDQGDALPDLGDLATASELVAGVRNFIRDSVVPDNAGRKGFLSRVSSNVLDIVLREQALGAAALAAESRRLRTLGYEAAALEVPERVQQQRRALVLALEEGTMNLNSRRLQGHLRQTVAQQLAIDQPKYSALKDQWGYPPPPVGA